MAHPTRVGRRVGALHKKLGHPCSKLTLDQKNEVLSWVDENCLLRLKDIVNLVQEKFNILTSKSAIDRILRGFHYTVTVNQQYWSLKEETMSEQSI